MTTQTIQMPDGRIIENVPVGTTKTQLEMKLDDRFQGIMKNTLEFEGGYVDNPNDRGGETNFGISKRAYPDLDIKNITKSQAKEIYYRDYYKKIQADKMSSKLGAVAFDYAVNSGGGRATKELQKIVGAKEDGVVGPETLGAINKYDEELLLSEYLDARRKRFINIADKDESQQGFLEGWLDRLDKLESKVRQY